MIYVFIGRMLRPLDRLTRALEEVGDGRFRTRFGGRLPPELARLRDSFNRMAARLADADADNRRLNAQLLTSREEERSELARDLHDEVGPYLFAIGADAALAARRLREDRAGKRRSSFNRLPTRYSTRIGRSGACSGGCARSGSKSRG
jgi:two-component system sensor histidine kinase UhpB